LNIRISAWRESKDMNLEIQSLKEQLERLERSNRRIKLGCILVFVCVAGLASMGARKSQNEQWRQTSSSCATLQATSAPVGIPMKSISIPL
jgi:hypothetical protein